MTTGLRAGRFTRTLAVCGVAVAALAYTGSGFAAAGHRAATDPSTLIVAVPSDIQNLDPTQSTGDTATQEFLGNVYDWLVDYKVMPGEGGSIGSPNQFVGGVAKSFSWNANKTVVTFHLRPGLKFANGDPIDANAVKFTYDRLFDQNGVTAALTEMAAVKSKNSITVVNPSTVKFTLTKANTLLFGNMAQFGHSILDPKVVKPHETKADPYAHNWLSSNVGGGASGPYILKSWQRGSQWVLAPNPNYGGPVKAKMKQIIFKVIPDASQRLALLKSGAVDMAFALPLKDVKSLQSDKDISVVDHSSRFVVYLGMNTKTKPFDNVKVRQAISEVVPYKTIIDQVMQGFGKQLTSPIPAGTPTHTDADFHYTGDVSKAKQLLKEAGFPKGFTTTLDVASGVDEGTQTAVWVKQALAQIGITVNIQQMPGATFTAQLQKHALGFFFANNWISINNDPFYHLYWLFRSTCCNYTNYVNPTVNKLIDQNLLSTNTAARAAASQKIQKTLVDQAAWVYLYQPDFLLAMRANVKGYVWYSSDEFTRFKYITKS